MNATTYTITATLYDGNIKYVLHDLALDAALIQVAQLDADGWENITTDPMLPEDAAAIAQEAHEKAVCCAVMFVCILAFIAATVIGFSI